MIYDVSTRTLNSPLLCPGNDCCLMMMYSGVWLPVHVCLGWQSVVPLQGDQMAQGSHHATSDASAVDARHAAADLSNRQLVLAQSLDGR